MDNTTRSERSRNAIIQAALAIIARDGPRRLTLDAIARESGISKGGLMHQFRSKEAVLKALLEYQAEYFEKFSQGYMAQASATSPEPLLATQIAVAREAVTTQQSVAFAILGAISEEPGLLSAFKEIDAKKIASIKAEAADPELAMLRWYAAKGLLLNALFGLCPLSDEERQRMFERLLDSKQWLVPGKA
ncbi:TetR/AcrR family transcriptional regulator [Collimonas sp. H4R21]|jgi:AcrR family transcriptional regulator|uniref:TetR/AcrR family transcriptional regulator n=1 Tax=Collimonas rhizosphaerae TaxID=3126357 RepID=A0ABU9Q1H7_9BURK|nr:TetR/AcrR family transcriptional regulator [Collimonas sp. OK412]SFC72427.1 transcriptional regulator, TetR family [Collimonas sp. OK412]